MNNILSLLFLAIVATCAAQSNPAASNTDSQIAEYVVEIFEDKKGNLWFGTISYGVARYDGNKLIYYTGADGLVGNTVVCMIEDNDGHLWFGTHSGLSKYDGKSFTNFTTKDGLCDNRIFNLLIDQGGMLWIATWEGVCRYNGTAFEDFPVPKPDVEILSYQNTLNWVTEIMEDRDGNIWIGRDGYGACKYDGKSFTHFTKKDGLASNNVQVITEDNHGNIWFGSRVVEKDNPDSNGRTGDGGLSRYDGQTIIRYPEVKGLSENDSYAIATDRNGNVWIGANGVGVYRFDGQNFTLYSDTDRKDLMPYGYGIQSILEDRNGTIWFGLSGGLFRLSGKSIMNVTKSGPWR